MNETMNETKATPMEKLATFIVDKRNLFFLLYIFALVFCIFSTNWVNVENDITKYLPDSTETRRGLTVMDEQFVTYGTAKVMISNISYEHALELQEEIEAVEGVTSAELDHTEDHYHDSSALFDVTFDGTATDDISLQAMNRMKELLADYDVYYDTEVGSDSAADLAAEMQVIVVIAAVIIVERFPLFPIQLQWCCSLPWQSTMRLFCATVFRMNIRHWIRGRPVLRP